MIEPQRLGADREADEARGRRRRRAGRRTARAALGVPRVAACCRRTRRRPARAIPSTASPRARRPPRAAVRRPSRRGRSPGSRTAWRPRWCWMPLVANRSFAPHGMPWSWPRYRPAGELLVGLRGLRQRQLLGERHDALERLAVLLQAREVHLREVGRGHLARADERRERGHRLERQVLEVRRDADDGRGDLEGLRARAGRRRALAGQVGPEA